MTVSADCISKTLDGRNLTPPEVMEDVREVLGNIDLDPASDSIANRWVQASSFYTIEDDGFTKDWKAKNVWLNPPGTSKSNGKTIKCSHWFQKFLYHFRREEIESGILLCYRAGSVGSMGRELLSFPTCITCGGSSSPTLNGSGRFSFYTVEDNISFAQPDNTQSSIFVCVSHSILVQQRFQRIFDKYGVIK